MKQIENIIKEFTLKKLIGFIIITFDIVVICGADSIGPEIVGAILLISYLIWRWLKLNNEFNFDDDED